MSEDFNVSNRPQIDQNFSVGGIQAKTTVAAPEKTSPASKLDSPEKTKAAQTSTPLTKADAAKFTKIACGFILIGLGSIGMAALSPVALPIGLLGAGAGYAAAKGLREFAGKQKNGEAIGSLVGASVGTLGCGALVAAGVHMIRGATKNSEAKTDAKVGVSAANPEIKKNEEAITKDVNQLLAKRSGVTFEESTYPELKSTMENKLNGLMEKKEISKEVHDNLIFKLNLNQTENKLFNKIDNFRSEIRREMHDLGEISQRKETYNTTLSTSLKNKEIGKEFFKSALKELEKFSEDHEIGKEYYPKRLESSFPYLIDRTNRELEFYSFSETLRNTAPNNSITDRFTLTEAIKENQGKAKLTITDNNIPNITKDNFMASNSGNSLLRGEMVATTITEINTFLSSGKTDLEKTEIGKNLKIIEFHLKHELNDKYGNAITPPTTDEVKNAYDTLRKYAKGTEAPAPKTAVNQESGVDKEINRLMDEVNEGMDDETFAKLAEYAPKTEPSTAEKTEASTVKNDPAAALFDEIDRMTGAKLDEVFDNLPKVEPETAPKAAPKTETTTVKNDPAADLFAEMEDMIKAARRTPGNNIKG